MKILVILTLSIALVCTSELQPDDSLNSTESTTPLMELVTTEKVTHIPLEMTKMSRNSYHFRPKKVLIFNDLKSSQAELVSSENANDSSFYTDICQFCPNVKFMQHYFARECTAMEVLEQCKPKFCPKFFDCPLEEEFPKNACRYNHTDYKFGEHIPTDDMCQHCVCTNSSTGPMLACAITECFDSWSKLSPNCYRKKIEGHCCPEVVCLPLNQTLPTCTFEGNTHQLGDYFSPQDDTCYNCLCDDKWNQTDSPLEHSCTRVQCGYDINHFQNRACVPVYSDKACCPIYYHCPDELSKKEQVKCKFGSNLYEIGQVVKVKQHEVCLECSCLIPPEITCRHKSCPLTPDNCTSYYIDGQCCPQIQCGTDHSPSVNVSLMSEVSKTQEQSSKCSVMDTCEEPCKLHLNNDNSSECPECRCDLVSSNERAQYTRKSPFVLQTVSEPKPKLEIQTCPDITCNFPCYIYRDNGNCPRCSCSNSSKQIERVRLFATYNLINVANKIQNEHQNETNRTTNL